MSSETVTKLEEVALKVGEATAGAVIDAIKGGERNVLTLTIIAGRAIEAGLAGASVEELAAIAIAAGDKVT